MMKVQQDMNNKSTKSIQNKNLSWFAEILSRANCKLSCEDLECSSHLKEHFPVVVARISSKSQGNALHH